MKDELNRVVVEEGKAIENLIALLEEQLKLALSNKIMELDAIVSKIEICNKKIAELEMSRRGITKGEPMSKIVNEFNDKELEANYIKVKLLVESAIVQKDFNMDHIKQGLSFNTRLLNIVNPDRGTKVYNAYGKMKK